MGTVRDLYQGGDNDPEVAPDAHYRHYVYCDGCGAFDLEPWMAPENHAALEAKRRRLGRWVLLLAPLVAAVGWIGLGFFPTLGWLLFLALGITVSVLVRVYWFERDRPRVLLAWHFVGVGVLWLVAILTVESLASDLVPAWLAFGVGLVAMVALLLWRNSLGSKIEDVGLRCRHCGATYAHGTLFFTDLDANPRHLTVADVPRPLGSSLFWTGASADVPPPAGPPSRLPE